jgi:hypothetical protein
MEKPGSLRAAIGQVFPDLARDVDRLRLWVEKGSIRCRQTQSRGFEWAYTLTAVMTDFTGHPSLVFLAVNDWLRVNQPDLLAAGNPESFSFQADILDDKTIDLQIDLRLTEQVRLVEREGGGWDLQHLSEPDPLFPELDPLSDPPSLLKQIWWKDELLVE